MQDFQIEGAPRIDFVHAAHIPIVKSLLAGVQGLLKGPGSSRNSWRNIGENLQNLTVTTTVGVPWRSCRRLGVFPHRRVHQGNSMVTELQIRDFGLLFYHFVLYSYNLSQFEYFYMVQRYQCRHLNHKICQSSLLFRDQRGICESVTEVLYQRILQLGRVPLNSITQ